MAHENEQERSIEINRILSRIRRHHGKCFERINDCIS
jgi:hypothetical protein